MTNQEALNDISNFIKSVRNKCEGAEKYSWTWGIYEDEIKQLTQALNELQNLKENYIGFEDMNYELKVCRKALTIINKQFGKGYKDEYYLDLARKELDYLCNHTG